MTDTALPVLRRADYSLSESEEAIKDSFERFFDREVPLSRAREAGALGFDQKLWTQLGEMEAVTVGLPERAGAGLVAGVLVCEQAGRVIAPVPLVEGLVAARALFAAGPAGRAALDAAADSLLMTVALQDAGRESVQLVPAGAVAHAAVCLAGRELVLVEPAAGPDLVDNQWYQPVARWRLDDVGGGRQTLAEGRAAVELFGQVRRDWKVLTAAMLVGVAQAALAMAVSYASERRAFGVPIGTFQAISHRLADSEMAVETARRLARKAAWFADHDPDDAARLASVALVHASETATTATHLAIHVLGGIGFTLEADAHLLFRKAKGYVLPGGDPKAELLYLADLHYGGR